MECTEIDLNKVCRTCKNEAPEMKSLYYRDSESGKENPRLDEILMACASVQVDTEDNLPKLICRSCFVQLKNAYTFKEQCEKTDVFLRDYVENIKNIKKETELPDLEFTASEVVCEIKPPVSYGESTNRDTIEESTDDVEVQLDEGVEKDGSDYIQIVDNNATIYKCRVCSKEFYTLEGVRCHKRLHMGKSFKCKQCDRCYTRLNQLQRHELSHSKRKMHVCKICNNRFIRYAHLKRHLITHLKDRPFSCLNCNRGFNRVEQLENHTPICKGKKVHVCDICNKAFLREDSMEVHKRLHENKEPVLPTLENLNNIEEHYMKIDLADEANVFSNEEDFDVEENMKPEVEVSESNDQIKTEEVTQITNDIYAEEDPPEMLLEKVKIEEELLLVRGDDNDAGDEQTVETDNGNDYESDNSAHSEYKPTKQSPPKVKRGRPRKYPVGYKSNGKPKVSKGSKGRPGLDRASKSQEELQRLECPECSAVFEQLKMFERHTDQHGLKLYECQTCNKQFSRLSSLKRHRLTHGELKPFECETCKKRFLRRDHFQKHMKSHLSSTSVTCDLCQAVFSRKESLAKHKSCKHNSGEVVVVVEKKFKCQYCPKAFTTMRNRDSHAKAHFGEKKFQCNTCEKTFISKSHLTEHMKFHNDSSKKFLCSECGQKFVRNDYLIIHMRRHQGEKPFKCKFCGKGFPRTTDLTAHERYHTGEKKHLCVVCGRGFVRAYSLTVHMRTHTGEKPYRCTYCDAAFAQGNDLKTHVRKHTGERFQCELCPDSFLEGYLLTQHKRVVHDMIVTPIESNQDLLEDPPRKMRKRFSFEEKKNILEEMNQHSRHVICEKYGINDRTLRKWKSVKEEIIQQAQKIDTKTLKKKSSAEEMDGAVFQWLVETLDQGIPVSGPMIRRQAWIMKENHPKNDEFKASEGWLSGFKERKQIRSLRITGEKLSADDVAAKS